MWRGQWGCLWVGSCEILPWIGAFLGLLETIAVALDFDDFGAVDEAVDEGDDAGGVREYLAPLGEGLVGGEEMGGRRRSVG